MTRSDLYLYYNNTDGSIVSVTKNIRPDLHEYPFMRIPYDIGEKFLDENQMKALLMHGPLISLMMHREIVEKAKLSEPLTINCLNSWLFRLNPDKDSNVALFYEKEINIPRPYIFNTNNRHMFVSAKNDPTVLLDSFDINLEEKYQVESVDADEYDVYVPNNERKRPEEKFFRMKENKSDKCFYVYYKKTNGSIISVSGSPVKDLQIYSINESR